MATIEYSVSTADEQVLKELEDRIEGRFWTCKQKEMAVDCLRILKLRFPEADDVIDEGLKDNTLNCVINSRARIFGAVSKDEIRSLLGH